MPVAPPTLAEIALRLLNFGAVERICAALEGGKLEQGATAAVQTALSDGAPEVKAAVRDLCKVWSKDYKTSAASAIAVALRASAEGIATERRRSPKAQVVWTGPAVEGSYVRATREVLRELVRGAKHSLVVVGYWLASPSEGEGIIQELIDLLADAVARGVDLTFILDERTRYDGVDNRKVLVQIWPKGVPFPKLLTWKLPAEDRHIKLHAKVMVADDVDALVTSANLTWYAMDRNMEMGVRITGQPAGVIAHHLRLMDQRGVFQPF